MITKDDVEVGTYYELVDEDYPEDSNIVYCYENIKGDIGFGFNASVGGRFMLLPIRNLNIYKLKIERVEFYA